MMETLQENQKNEYDDLYIAEFSRNTLLLDDTNNDNDTDSNNIEEIEENIRSYHTNQISDDN